MVTPVVARLALLVVLALLGFASLQQPREGTTLAQVVTATPTATRTSTASVGLAAPDSRFAQVARGTPATFAICCCVWPRASRSASASRQRKKTEQRAYLSRGDARSISHGR